MQQQITLVHLQCIGIIEEIVENSYFPTVDLVLRTLLNRYQVVCFEHIGIGSIECIPCLMWLSDISNKVSNFVISHFGLNFIVSFEDLDSLVASMLLSFNTPTLATMKATFCIETADINEIDIGDVDVSTSNSFVYFGLGSLSSHHVVHDYISQYWTDKSDNDDTCVSLVTCTAVGHFVDFICSENDSPGTSGELSMRQYKVNMLHSNPDQFSNLFQDYICQLYDVNHVGELGLYIMNIVKPHISTLPHASKQLHSCPREPLLGCLSSLWQMISHVIRARERMHVAIQKDYLRELQSNYDDHFDEKIGPKKPKRRKKKTVVDDCTGNVSSAAINVTDLSSVTIDDNLNNNGGCRSPDESAMSRTSLDTVFPKNHKDGNASCVNTDTVSDAVITTITTGMQKDLSAMSSSGVVLPHLRSPGLVEEMSVVGSQQLRSCLPSITLSNSVNTASYISDIGRWGECLVFQYLLSLQSVSTGKTPTGKEGSVKSIVSSVEWTNEAGETMSPFDIKMLERGANGATSTRFIEVKSTIYDDRNVFALSLNEWEFARAISEPNYDLYRVYNAGNPKTVRICILRNIYKLVKEQKCKLCLSL